MTELNKALDTARFAWSLDQVLGPGLQPSDMVVLNDLPMYKTDADRSGRRVVAVFASYSPDCTFSELPSLRRV